MSEWLGASFCENVDALLMLALCIVIFLVAVAVSFVVTSTRLRDRG